MIVGRRSVSIIFATWSGRKFPIQQVDIPCDTAIRSMHIHAAEQSNTNFENPCLNLVPGSVPQNTQTTEHSRTYNWPIQAADNPAFLSLSVT